jgi:hypothetical protein
MKRITRFILVIWFINFTIFILCVITEAFLGITEVPRWTQLWGVINLSIPFLLGLIWFISQFKSIIEDIKEFINE